MKIELNEKDYEFLKELQHELNTQENDGNANPVFWGVEETVEECRGGVIVSPEWIVYDK